MLRKKKVTKRAKKTAKKKATKRAGRKQAIKKIIEPNSPKGDKVIQGLSERYLSMKELVFVEHYIASGMQIAWKSYLKAFECSEKGAKNRAYKLLKRENIIAEIRSRVEASGITDDWITEQSKKYVILGLIDDKYASAGTKSLGLLAQVKGMLVDTIRHEFTGENPAVFLPMTSKETAKKIEESGRLME